MKPRSEQRDQIWAITERCVSCGSCEAACRSRRGVARLRHPRHGNPVVFPEVCRHCTSPACVEACISSALSRDPDSGDLEFNADRCVACWSCIMACPYGAVRRDLGTRPTTVRCDRCVDYRRMGCVSACPTGAMRAGGSASLRADTARTEKLGTPLTKAAVCIALPVTGLLVGLVDVPWISENRHALGIAGGGLMAVSLVLPLIGMALRSVMRRSFWSSLHIWTGSTAATLALVHAGGRLGANVQTLAAFLILSLVVAATAYRYLRPLVKTWEAILHRGAWVVSSRDDTGAPRRDPSVEAMVAGASQARARQASLGRLAGLLASCKTLHVVLAIAATGLVLAHVVIRVTIGAN